MRWHTRKPFVSLKRKCIVYLQICPKFTTIGSFELMSPIEESFPQNRAQKHYISNIDTKMPWKETYCKLFPRFC